MDSPGFGAAMLLPELLHWIWENDGITRSRARKGNPAPKRPRNLTRWDELVVEWVTPGWPPRETGLGAGIFKTTFINVFLGDFFIDGGRYFSTVDFWILTSDVKGNFTLKESPIETVTTGRELH